MVSSVSNSYSSMASLLFQKLDSKSQGYLEKSDLESAFATISDNSSGSGIDNLFSALDTDSDGKVSESEFTSTLSQIQEQLDSQFNQMRMQGQGGHGGPQGMAGMPPPPPQDDGFTKEELQAQLDEMGSSDSQRSSLISKVLDNFDGADTDGDGKVTFKEAMALQNSSSDKTSTSSSGATDATDTTASEQLAAALMQAVGGMPPPPPQNDTGFTEEELKAQLAEIGSSDSKRSSLISTVLNNFDSADSNGDGKVSVQEAMALQDSSASSTASTANNSVSAASSTSNDADVMFKIMQLMHAYGGFERQQNISVLSASA